MFFNCKIEKLFCILFFCSNECLREKESFQLSIFSCNSCFLNLLDERHVQRLSKLCDQPRGGSRCLAKSEMADTRARIQELIFAENKCAYVAIHSESFGINYVLFAVVAFT